MIQESTMAMLELINQPAFCVQDGVITKINQAAESSTIPPGCKINDFLTTGRQELDDLTDGCLYLTLTLNGMEQEASVVRLDECDVYVLDQGAKQPELQAYALASQMLREPMAAMIAAADHLISSVSNAGHPPMQKDIASVSKAEFQLLRILGNMSDANRYVTGTASRLQMRDITALLADLFEHLAALCQMRKITLSFSNLSQTIYCLVDEEKLERAVNNIISNAVKFTPDGGTIDARLVRRDCKLYLTVQDSGCGIPPQQRSSIHSRYLRSPGLEDGLHGIGLGMVLIRSAARAHGGTVLVEQPKDLGLRITFTMEIMQDNKNMVHSPSLQVDYAGEWDHSLIELSESLPASAYTEHTDTE